jgi:hypothetical protein
MDHAVPCVNLPIMVCVRELCFEHSERVEVTVVHFVKFERNKEGE